VFAQRCVDGCPATADNVNLGRTANHDEAIANESIDLVRGQQGQSRV
jgi:hypothetical protein